MELITMNIPDMNKAKIRHKNDVKYTKYNYNDEKFGTNKKFFLRTYGCQMNEHDSENIKGMLESVGYIETDDMNSSDLIILNTCAIRENAHDKVFGFLGVIDHLKKSKKDTIVGICGCMSQEKNVVDKIMSKYKYVDFICGTHDLC